MIKKRYLQAVLFIIIVCISLSLLSACTVDLASKNPKQKAAQKAADDVPISEEEKSFVIGKDFTEEDCEMPMAIIDDMCCYDKNEDGMCDGTDTGAICGNKICEKIENECGCPQDCGKCGENITKPVCMHYECNKNEECAAVKDSICCGDGICDENAGICGICFQDCCRADDLPEEKASFAFYPKMAAGFPTVVGDKAPPEDVIIAADILTHIASENLTVGRGKLASEVNLSRGNYIVVGTPCENKAAADLFRKEIYKNNQSCEIFKKGDSFVRIFPTSLSTIAIYVGGYTYVTTEKASKLLMDYRDKNLTGSSLRA